MIPAFSMELCAKHGFQIVLRRRVQDAEKGGDGSHDQNDQARHGSVAGTRSRLTRMMP